MNCHMARTPSGKAKAPSIKDVATLAGVSAPTVSRFLNTPERVSEGKRENISEAIAKLNYRPNAIARALVREQSRQCLVLSSNTTLFGQVQTIRGIEIAARDSGYALNIGVIAGSSQESIQSSLNNSLEHNPAGVIVLNFDENSDRALHIMPQGTPLVAVAGKRDENIAWISMGEEEGGYLITRHLLRCGAKKVYAVGIPGGGGANDRLGGWRRACQEAGVPMPTPIEAGWDAENARSVGRMLGKNGDVEAVFAGNDEVAMGVIRGLNDCGLKVPDDVLVAGFDDHPLGRIWNPSLTTIRQNFQAVGQEAFAMLLPMIDEVRNGREHSGCWTASHTFVGDLIIRESTARAIAK